MSCFRSKLGSNPRNEGITQEISRDWSIDYTCHLVRPCSYKGSKVSEPAAAINFEGMTFPGFFFAVPCSLCHVSLSVDCFLFASPTKAAEAGSSLQLRSCKPELQQSTLRAFELVVHTFCPASMSGLRNVHADVLADASQASTVEDFSRGPIMAREWPKVPSNRSLVAVPSQSLLLSRQRTIQANEDDALTQLFGPGILKEFLVLVLL